MFPQKFDCVTVFVFTKTQQHVLSFYIFLINVGYLLSLWIFTYLWNSSCQVTRRLRGQFVNVGLCWSKEKWGGSESCPHTRFRAIINDKLFIIVYSKIHKVLFFHAVLWIVWYFIHNEYYLMVLNSILKSGHFLKMRGS